MIIAIRANPVHEIVERVQMMQGTYHVLDALNAYTWYYSKLWEGNGFPAADDPTPHMERTSGPETTFDIFTLTRTRFRSQQEGDIYCAQNTDPNVCSGTQARGTALAPTRYYGIDISAPVVTSNQTFRIILGPRVYTLRALWNLDSDVGDVDVSGRLFTAHLPDVGGVRIIFNAVTSEATMYGAPQSFRNYLVGQSLYDIHMYRGGTCGDDASTICPGAITELNVPCSGHGRCESSCQCTCDKAPHEMLMEALVVGENAPNTPDGALTVQDNPLRTPYRGDGCEITCPGYDGFTMESVCSGRGTCGDTGQCMCDYGYIGDNCQFACPGFDGTADSVENICSKKGSCEVTDISPTSFRSTDSLNRDRFLRAMRQFYGRCHTFIADNQRNNATHFPGDRCDVDADCSTGYCDRVAPDVFENEKEPPHMYVLLDVGLHGVTPVEAPADPKRYCSRLSDCVGFAGPLIFLGTSAYVTEGNTSIYVKDPFFTSLNISGLMYGRESMDRPCRIVETVSNDTWVYRPFIREFVQKYDEAVASQEWEGLMTASTVSDDAAPTLVSTRTCEIHPNFVLRCPTCLCFRSRVQGFFDGPMCEQCARGYATETCKTKCPGFDGKNIETACSGLGLCNMGKEGTGQCLCGGAGGSRSTAETTRVLPLYRDIDAPYGGATNAFCAVWNTQTACEEQTGCTWNRRCLPKRTGGERAVPSPPLLPFEATYFVGQYREFSTFLWPQVTPDIILDFEHWENGEMKNSDGDVQCRDFPGVTCDPDHGIEFINNAGTVVEVEKLSDMCPRDSVDVKKLRMMSVYTSDVEKYYRACCRCGGGQRGHGLPTSALKVASSYESSCEDTWKNDCNMLNMNQKLLFVHDTTVTYSYNKQQAKDFCQNKGLTLCTKDALKRYADTNSVNICKTGWFIDESVPSWYVPVGQSSSGCGYEGWNYWVPDSGLAAPHCCQYSPRMRELPYGAPSSCVVSPSAEECEAYALTSGYTFHTLSSSTSISGCHRWSGNTNRVYYNYGTGLASWPSNAFVCIENICSNGQVNTSTSLDWTSFRDRDGITPDIGCCSCGGGKPSITPAPCKEPIYTRDDNQSCTAAIPNAYNEAQCEAECSLDVSCFAYQWNGVACAHSTSAVENSVTVLGTTCFRKENHERCAGWGCANVIGVNCSSCSNPGARKGCCICGGGVDSNAPVVPFRVRPNPRLTADSYPVSVSEIERRTASKINFPFEFAGVDKIRQQRRLGTSVCPDCPDSDCNKCPNDCALCVNGYSGFNCGDLCGTCVLGGTCVSKPTDGVTLCDCPSSSSSERHNCCPNGFVLLSNTQTLTRPNQIGGIAAGLATYGAFSSDADPRSVTYFDGDEDANLVSGCYPCPGVTTSAEICMHPFCEDSLVDVPDRCRTENQYRVGYANLWRTIKPTSWIFHVFAACNQYGSTMYNTFDDAVAACDDGCFGIEEHVTQRTYTLCTGLKPYNEKEHVVWEKTSLGVCFDATTEETAEMRHWRNVYAASSGYASNVCHGRLDQCMVDFNGGGNVFDDRTVCGTCFAEDVDMSLAHGRDCQPCGYGEFGEKPTGETFSTTCQTCPLGRGMPGIIGAWQEYTSAPTGTCTTGITDETECTKDPSCKCYISDGVYYTKTGFHTAPGYRCSINNEIIDCAVKDSYSCYTTNGTTCYGSSNFTIEEDRESTAYVNSYKSGGPCQTCFIGRFSSSDSSVCEVCGKGMYQDVPGSTSCKSCPYGYYTTKGSGAEGHDEASDCTPCPAGKFSLERFMDDDSSCQDCAPGQSTPLYNPTTSGGSVPGLMDDSVQSLTLSDIRHYCSECPSGWYKFVSIEDWTPPLPTNKCEQCPMGRFQAATGQSTCTKCDMGKQTGNFGSIQCYLCEEGSIANIDNTGCESCPSGRRAHAGTTCELCPSGYYGDSGNCFGCFVGQYNPTQGETSCKNCEIGKFSGQVNSADCTFCAPGRYTSEVATSECKLCPAGYAQPSLGAFDCIECLPGTYRPEGSTEERCLLCPVGYYQYSYTSSYCIACESGKTSPVGAITGSQCVQCNLGQYVLEGGNCQDCPAGYYQDVSMQSSCKSCPEYRAFSEVASTSFSGCGCAQEQRWQGHYCAACPAGYKSDPTPHWNPNYCASINPPVGLAVVHYQTVSSNCGHSVVASGTNNGIPGTVTNWWDTGYRVGSFGYINGFLQYGTTLRLKYYKTNGQLWKNSKIPCIGGLIDSKWYDASPIRSPLALYLIHEPPSSANPGCCGANNCGYDWKLRGFEISIESC